MACSFKTLISLPMKKLLFFCLFLSWHYANSQIGGNSTYQFLNTVTSARVAGQGSNAIANPENDLNFALYNPALLRPEMHGQFTTSVVDYVSDILYGDVAYAHNFDSLGTFMLQMVYMNYGTFDNTNEVGQKLGQFSVADYSFNLGYSLSLDSNWRIGGMMKVINSDYSFYDSWGLAFNAGITYRIPQKRLTFALIAKNAGFQINLYHEERERLPFELQLGVSNRFEHLPLRWQITYEQLETWDLRYRDPNAATVNQFTGEVDDNFPSIWNNLLRHFVLGLEFKPTDAFNLQFGYNFRKRQELNLATRRTSAGFSFGGGVRIYRFYLQYSRNINHIAGGANHISISTDFQSFRKKERGVPQN